MGKVAKILLQLILMPVVLLLLLAAAILPPVSFAFETYDLAKSSGTARATIQNVATTLSTRGSRPVIAYTYCAGDHRYQSERYLPGFGGNWGTWTGGGNAASHYRVGQQVTIHYRPDDPQHSFLEFGWFKWTVFLFLLWCFGVTSGLSRQNLLASPNPVINAAASAILFGAFLLLFASPNAVRPGELHWYAGSFVLLWLLLYGRLRITVARRRVTEQP